jgi:hypothetical protein
MELNNEQQIMDSSSDINYSQYLQLVTPFTKSDNKFEKQAAYDFRILLISVMNENEIYVLLYLHEGIRKSIQYFVKELSDLIQNKYNNIKYDTHLELLHDCACLISQQVMFRSKLSETLDFLMNL